MREKGENPISLPKSIPAKLPGSVHPQYVTCGNPNCKCARGERHGPYWYRFWRDGDGRLHKQYVKQADLAAVRQACDAWQAEQRRVRALLAGWPALKRRFDRREWDPNDWMRLGLDYSAAVQQLIALIRDDAGRPMQQLRAAAALYEIKTGRRLRF